MSNIINRNYEDIQHITGTTSGSTANAHRQIANERLPDGCVPECRIDESSAVVTTIACVLCGRKHHPVFLGIQEVPDTRHGTFFCQGCLQHMRQQQLGPKEREVRLVTLEALVASQGVEHALLKKKLEKMDSCLAVVVRLLRLAHTKSQLMGVASTGSDTVALDMLAEFEALATLQNDAPNNIESCVSVENFTESDAQSISTTEIKVIKVEGADSDTPIRTDKPGVSPDSSQTSANDMIHITAVDNQLPVVDAVPASSDTRPLPQNSDKMVTVPGSSDAQPASQNADEATRFIDRPYQCMACPANFSRAWDLAKHETNLHDMQTVRQPRHNYVDVDYEECTLCPLRFAKGKYVRSSIQRHMKRDHPKNRPQPNLKFVECKQCPMRFAKPPHLLLHVTKMHSGAKRAGKTDAKRRRNSESDFEVEDEPNEAAELGDEYEQCTLCPLIFAKNRYTLGAHMKKEHADKVPQPDLEFVECKFCPMRFAKSGNLLLHVTVMHTCSDRVGGPVRKRRSRQSAASVTDEESSNDVAKSVEGESGDGEAMTKKVEAVGRPRRARCTSCPMVFANDTLLQEHAKTCKPKPDILDSDLEQSPPVSPAPSPSPVSSPSLAPSPTPAPSPSPSKSVPKVSYAAAAVTSASQFRCTLCPERFLLKGFLLEHYRQKHDDRVMDDSITPYSCEFCEARFQQLNHKHSHVAKCLERLKQQNQKGSGTCGKSIEELSREDFDDQIVIDAASSSTSRHIEDDADLITID